MRLCGIFFAAPAALVILMGLSGCDVARAHPVSVAEAANERRPLTMRVVAVEDTLMATETTELGVTHYLTVEVLDGPGEWRGRHVVLPYDAWSVGAAPPARGALVTASPARWVRGDGTSHGIPRSGFRRSDLPPETPSTP